METFFIGPGDEVLVPEPTYPNNLLNPELLGGTTVSVPLSPEDNYQLSIPELETRITDRSKMVLLCHPNNPTTTVYPGKDRTEQTVLECWLLNPPTDC